ncbi:flagellin lysine-N-methylase [Paucibacter sp. AS339]|uniref:flagellin lysine-N-methylase n=1 Tax=Paucibacter hankyongi TaxID=3133434 RepID=UPI0030AB62E1
MGRFSPVVQAPRYLKQFQCVGSACPESCCANWQVSIDKPTYQRYQAVKIEPLASLMRQHIHKTETNRRDAETYAEIKLRLGDSCPFLDATSLCQIQSNLGAAALSGTCAEYPRIYLRDGSRQGLVATLSCPEAARLAMASDDAMDMVDITLDFANPSLVPVRRQRKEPSAAETDLVRKHAVLLGQVVEAVVRAPQLSASQALVYSGLILRRVVGLAQLPLEEAESGLAKAVNDYISPHSLQQVPALTGGLAVPKEVQLDLMLGALQRYQHDQHGARGMRPSFLALLDELVQGLQLNRGVARELSLEAYCCAERDFYLPSVVAFPHALKNYLLNALAAGLFPRQSSAGLGEEFMHLALRFGLIKFLLIGLAAKKGRILDLDDYSRVIFVVARNIEHNQRFMPEVLQVMQEHQALGLEFVATLVA